MIGRPTKYTEELANQICEEIQTSSIGLNHICKKLKIAPSSVYLWLKEHKEFSEKYARARELQADFLVDEILEISDDGSNDYMTIIKNDQEYTVENKEWTNRSRLRVDARKWVASKLAPKKYGDRIQQDINQKVTTVTFVDNGDTNSSSESH